MTTFYILSILTFDLNNPGTFDLPKREERIADQFAQFIEKEKYLF